MHLLQGNHRSNGFIKVCELIQCMDRPIIETAFRTRQQLETTLNKYDEALIESCKFSGIEVLPLPPRARLAEYFEATAGCNIVDAHIYSRLTCMIKEKKNASRRASVGYKISVRSKDTWYTHFLVPESNSQQWSIQERVFTDVDFNAAEKRVGATLAVAGKTFHEGVDVHEINNMGVIIRAPYGTFDGFLRTHASQVNAPGYRFRTSANELSVTPEAMVTKKMVSPTLDRLVDIANTTLGILEKDMGEHVPYFEHPKR
jgi:hypothetical protein